MKIGIIGIGNVGKALSAYLSSFDNFVVIKVDKGDDYNSLKDVSYCFVAVPTPYDEENETIDDSLVKEAVKNLLAVNNNVDIFIKSTLGVGQTRRIIEANNYLRIYYTPEFLRQKEALEDITHPYRLIIGTYDKKENRAVEFYFNIFQSNKKHLLSLEEAEAAKLYSNAYLATRIAFFNELDTFASINNLNSEDIIKALSDDPRIGDYYNKPSKYGYGGKCLPKDVKGLASLSKATPNILSYSVIASNEAHQEYFIYEILNKLKNSKRKVVGINGVPDKDDALVVIIKKLQVVGVTVLIYDQSYQEEKVYDCYIMNDKNDYLKAIEFEI